MPTKIQLDAVPDDLYRTLHSRAGKAGLSLSEFLLLEIRALAPGLAPDCARSAADRDAGSTRSNRAVEETDSP